MKQSSIARYTRRDFLRELALGAVSLTAASAFSEEIARFVESGDFAEELIVTPRMTEGPFYPDRLPLDKDNDLIIINNSLTPAVGAITHLSGTIKDVKGYPIRNALIEIWQVDNQGSYLHSQGAGRQGRDSNFQGYGRFETDSTGAYKFRTIKPVIYPGRTPHIHVKVSKGGRELLTTQCFIQGERMNDRDGVLNGVRDPKARASVIVPFLPKADSKTGELTARFDIILGYTPKD